MSERLIVYSCHGNAKDHNGTMGHLRDFAMKLNTSCTNDMGVEVADGNEESPATSSLLREAMLILRRDDGSCPFDDGLEELVQMATRHCDRSKPRRDKADLSLDRRRMVALWDERGTREIASSLSDRVFVVSDKRVTSITGKGEAHGTARGQLCFLVRDYKNILWHEAAHLFGAEDHYDEHNHEPTRGCMDWSHPRREWSCIMQWDPGKKDCWFCPRAIKEIQRYFAGRISLREGMRKRTPR
jgi:hypothetical protein